MKWLKREDIPDWVVDEASEKTFQPPAWMLQDEIPHIITASYGSEGPPLWLLNLDKLPEV